MSLRRKFLIASIIAALAPMVSWQALRQTATTLRHEQEQSLLSQTRVIARALATLPIEALPGGTSMPVLQIHSAIRVDGYADDWPPSRSSDQSNSSARVTLVLDSRGLYLLAEVRDASRQRPDPRDPTLRNADYLELGLAIGDEQRRYRIASAGPGRFEVAAENEGQRLPDSLSGEWQEDGSGYRIELRLPQALLDGRIFWSAHDASERSSSSSEPPPWRSVIGPRPLTEQTLRSLSLPGLRLRLYSRDAIELASSDHADAGVAIGQTRVESQPHWLDHLLLWGAVNVSPADAIESPRSDASLIWQALSGVPASVWSDDGESQPWLGIAVPFPTRGATSGVLLIEKFGEPGHDAQRSALAWLLASLAATLLTTVALLALGGKLVQRILRLHESVAGRASDQSPSDTIAPLHDNDELGDLVRHHARLNDDVATWTEYLRSLTSRLSHELNTPLAIVKSSLENLDQSLGTDAVRGYLGRARDGADRLAAIVRAMSESNRIERAITSADAEDFDLGQLVAGCAAGYAALAADRDIRIDVPATALRFHGAPELIAQALDKLFDNARSFTPVGGWIRFSLHAESVQTGDEAVLIRVANQGQPLPSSMRDQLFDTLVSVRERSSRSAGEVPHLGLGLYVVKLVAELHRGDASARNLDDGSGVEFVLSLRGMSRRRLTDSPPIT
ncbi:MAG: ATP-binding protein [Dokdonella sp.]